MSRVLKFLKWAAISMTILLLLIVVLSDFIIHFVFHDLPFMGKNFDRAVWSSALDCKNDLDCLDKESACLRGEMYRDLEKNYLLQGIQRSKVVELLGEPIKVTADNCSDYVLGYCSGVKMDGDYLRVCFDERQKLECVFHWQS